MGHHATEHDDRAQSGNHLTGRGSLARRGRAGGSATASRVISVYLTRVRKRRAGEDRIPQTGGFARACPSSIAARRAARRRRARSSPIGCSPRITQAVSRPSFACANRSQVVNGSVLSARGGTSARSSATTENPPARRIKSSARMRIQDGSIDKGPRPETSGPGKRRALSPTAPDRDPLPLARPSADRIDRTHRPGQRVPPSRVAAAKVASNTLPRPEDRPPTSSDTSPNGQPPPNGPSNASIPIGNRRLSGRTSRAVTVLSSFRV